MTVNLAAAALGLLSGAACQYINFIVLKHVFRDFGSGAFVFKGIFLTLFRLAFAACTLLLLSRISEFALICGALGYMAMTAVTVIRTSQKESRRNFGCSFGAGQEGGEKL